MNKSEQINELATALSKAQGELRGVVKDSSNPFFKAKYATLSACIDSIREVFAKYGLSIIQIPEIHLHPGTGDGDATVVCVATILLHASGQWIGGSLMMRPMKADPQSMGSCITYARRYSLMSMAGLAPEDDDANMASGKAEPLVLRKEERVDYGKR